MNIKLIYFAALLFLIFSCTDNETDVDDNPDQEEGVNLEAVIDIITGSSEKVWKLNEANFSNAQVSDLNITSLFNVQDDEFRFLSTTNNSLELRHVRGFDINTQGQDLNSIQSDSNASSLTVDLSLADASSFQFTNNTDTYRFTYDEVNELLSGTIIFEGGATLDLILEEKVLTDYIDAPLTTSNMVELFTFEGLGRVGFKVSPSDNSLFITVRVDQLGLGAQQAIKYDLDTDQATTFNYVFHDFATKTIEFIDGSIVSFGGTGIEVFDYSFNAIIEEYRPSPPVNIPILIGSASLDDTIYYLGGNGHGPLGALISIQQPTDGEITTLVDLGSENEKNNADGEIVDNIAYIFGGQNVPFNTPDPNANQIISYNIETEQLQILNENTLDVLLFNSFTSTVENIIYVASGDASGDQDGDGNYLGAFNTLDQSMQEISISIPNNEQIIHFQATADSFYIITSRSVDNTIIHTLYRSTI